LRTHARTVELIRLARLSVPRGTQWLVAPSALAALTDAAPRHDHAWPGASVVPSSQSVWLWKGTATWG